MNSLSFLPSDEVGRYDDFKFSRDELVFIFGLTNSLAEEIECRETGSDANELVGATYAGISGRSKDATGSESVDGICKSSSDSIGNSPISESDTNIGDKVGDGVDGGEGE